MPPARADDAFHPEAAAELEKNREWVSVSFKQGSTVMVTAFRFWYPFDAKSVYPLLTDTNSFPKLHKSYFDARTLNEQIYETIQDQKPNSVEALVKLLGDTRVKSDFHRQPDGHWNDYFYQNFNFPWPLSNRWTVTKARIDESKATKGRYRLEFKMLIGNFKSNEGWWELVPIPGQPQWCEWRGRYESDPGIPMPRFVTKQGVKVGLKREVEENLAWLKKKYGTR